MPSVFQQMTRQVYNAEPYSLTGKIENIVGMSIEASGGRAAVGDICRIYNGDSGGQITAEGGGVQKHHILPLPHSAMRGLSGGKFAGSFTHLPAPPTGPHLRRPLLSVKKKNC